MEIIVQHVLLYKVHRMKSEQKKTFQSQSWIDTDKEYQQMHLELAAMRSGVALPDP